MLYTGRNMNSKSILPESAQPERHYSFQADMKLNVWAFVAVALAFWSRILLKHHPEWNDPLRAAVALSPLLPSLLYVRSVAKWIRGMDELQRRIQLEACLFATVGAIFVVTAFDLLKAHGIQIPRLHAGLGWEGTFACVVVFYFLGSVIINRRYK